MPKTKEELHADVENVLQVLRQGLAMHGGNVELVDVDPVTGKVSLRLQGACVGCPMSELTLHSGIEETLKEMVPEVTEVVNLEAAEAPSTSQEHPHLHA
jgi:Fe-S cluster biogenesis protein NfuA